MPINDAAYTDRARAESFGAVAESYDRYRTSYPDGLFADLVELNPDRVLDVACGTGKVAVPLLACGLAVLGLEPDPKMAAIAQRHGIIVEVSEFETWDADGRSFGLITCGQGWHWLDPEIAIPKAAQLLKPGGTLALFWSYPDFHERVRVAIERVYEKHAPDLVGDHDAVRTRSPHLEALEASDAFAHVETKTYRWNRTFTADEWLGRTATFSDHLRLPREQLDALLVALREVIEAEGGGSIEASFATYTILARTAE